MRRVVVTGFGVLSPLGIGVDKNWSSVMNGVSGIRLIDHLDVSCLRAKVCGQVWDYCPDDHFDKKFQRRIDPFMQYGIVAAREALSVSGIDTSSLDSYSCGVSIGSGIGGLSSIETEQNNIIANGPRRVSPFFVPGTISNMISGLVSIEYGFKGPNYGIVSACATGAHSVIAAAQQIQLGQAHVMLAGGSEHASGMLGMSGFSAMRALSSNPDPDAACRPWDKNRDGFVLSDGAGVLVLESLEHAMHREATIYAELVGYGQSSDSYHMNMPEPEGDAALYCIKQAMDRARISPKSLGYINAHATSTPLGDQIEPKILKHLCGSYAEHVPMSSTKSMHGHMLGAAGAVEAIWTVLALYHQVLPPTIHCDEPDVGCDHDLVSEPGRKHTLEYALSNSFGFGGTNASLLFRKYL